MSFAAGTFTLVTGNPVVTGTTISSTVYNNTMTDFATGLSTCILKDGTQTTTAAIPFALGILTGSVSSSSGVIAIKPATSESARFTTDSGGFFKASNTGTYLSATGTYHEFKSNAAEYVGYLTNSNAAPNGIAVNYSAAAPNDTTHEFGQFYDTGGARFLIRSNGGLANYSANDVNLSDMNAKKIFESYTEEMLDDLEERWLRIDRGRFKYTDQTHDDWNYGKSAQSVKAAIPELADVWNPTKRVIVGTDSAGKDIVETQQTPQAEQLLCEYSHDISQIGEALLARLVKRVRALEEKVG